MWIWVALCHRPTCSHHRFERLLRATSRVLSFLEPYILYTHFRKCVFWLPEGRHFQTTVLCFYTFTSHGYLTNCPCNILGSKCSKLVYELSTAPVADRRCRPLTRTQEDTGHGKLFGPRGLAYLQLLGLVSSLPDRPQPALGLPEVAALQGQPSLAQLPPSLATSC